MPAEAESRDSSLEAENARLRAQLERFAATGDLVTLNDEQVLQDVGIYRYHHPLETAVAYKTRLRVSIGIQ